MIRNDPFVHTVEFKSRPFGIEWTTLDRGLHLFVEEVIPMSTAAKSDVFEKSTVVALNGKDVGNSLSGEVLEEIEDASLPLRITFRRPADYECVLSIDLFMM